MAVGDRTRFYAANASMKAPSLKAERLRAPCFSVVDAGERIGLTDAAVIAPQGQDAGPRLLEDALELCDHRLGRAGDDAQVGHLLFEAGLAARILRPSGGELDESAARGW